VASWRWERRCATVALTLGLAAGAGAETISLSGDYGYEPYVARDLVPGTLVDARGARFRLANSKNSSPTESADCESGALPDNRYPLRLYGSPSVVVIGGQFDGEVPLNADWQHTYCNSAAVGVWNSPNATVEGVRGRRVWDAIRFSEESHLFKLQEVWLSEVRDDCVENDFLRSGLIKDVLFDGCFAGISVRQSGGRTDDRSMETVTLAGVLMRMQPYLYRGEVRQGSPIKAEGESPAFQIYDSVFVINGAEFLSRTQVEIGWAKITDCRNNLLLWASDSPWPRNLAEPPSCFRVVQGDEARSLWESIRQNWIDCHFLMPRFSDDTASDPLRCDVSFYGGQY
jgi:hypothetical protein